MRAYVLERKRTENDLKGAGQFRQFSQHYISGYRKVHKSKKPLSISLYSYLLPTGTATQNYRNSEINCLSEVKIMGVTCHVQASEVNRVGKPGITVFYCIYCTTVPGTVQYSIYRHLKKTGCTVL